MSSNHYGNMGNEMKAMKDAREKLVADTSKANAELKAETHAKLADARKFMADTSKANAKLANETHQVLADADKMVAGIRKDVAGLKTQTHQVLAEAAATVKQLAQDSRKRAAGWQDALRTVHGGGQSRRAGASTATAVMEPPVKAKPKSEAKKKARAKKR